MQNRIFHVKCVPAQQMSADKLYKRFRLSSGTKKFWAWSGFKLFIKIFKHLLLKQLGQMNSQFHMETRSGDQTGLLKLPLVLVLICI